LNACGPAINACGIYGHNSDSNSSQKDDGKFGCPLTQVFGAKC
jgi:hypothetical protein